MMPLLQRMAAAAVGATMLQTDWRGKMASDISVLDYQIYVIGLVNFLFKNGLRPT